MGGGDVGSEVGDVRLRCQRPVSLERGPVRIILLSRVIFTLVVLNVASHPSSTICAMEIRFVFMSGRMWAVLASSDSPLRWSFVVCVESMVLPFGLETEIWRVAGVMCAEGNMPGWIKWAVLPVSAMAVICGWDWAKVDIELI